MLVALSAALAQGLVAVGATHHHASHVNLARVVIGLCNLGLGRSGGYASQSARSASGRPPCSGWGEAGQRLLGPGVVYIGSGDLGDGAHLVDGIECGDLVGLGQGG